MIEVVSHSSYEFFSLYQTLPTISFSPEMLSLHIIQIPIRFGLYCILHYPFISLSASLPWAIFFEARASQKWLLCINVAPTVPSIHVRRSLRLVPNLPADISLLFQMALTSTFLKASI